jgi:hypothetical protein
MWFRSHAFILQRFHDLVQQAMHDPQQLQRVFTFLSPYVAQLEHLVALEPLVQALMDADLSRHEWRMHLIQHVLGPVTSNASVHMFAHKMLCMQLQRRMLQTICDHALCRETLDDTLLDELQESFKMAVSCLTAHNQDDHSVGWIGVAGSAFHLLSTVIKYQQLVIHHHSVRTPIVHPVVHGVSSTLPVLSNFCFWMLLRNIGATEHHLQLIQCAQAHLDVVTVLPSLIACGYTVRPDYVEDCYHTLQVSTVVPYVIESLMDYLSMVSFDRTVCRKLIMALPIIKACIQDNLYDTMHAHATLSCMKLHASLGMLE